MSLVAKGLGALDIRVIARDLIVVALGILIAIWVDDWVNERADRDEEQLILRGLQEEFEANLSHLLVVSRTWDIGLRANVELLKFVGAPEADLDKDRIVALMQELDWRTYDPRMGQLRSVITSGKLPLIGNPSLRAKAAEWPDLVDDMLDDEEWLTDYYLGQRESLHRAIPMLPGSRLQWEPTDVFQDVLLGNDLVNMQSTFELLVSERDEVVAATQDILALIEEELE